jgi:hypothetical protein
MMVVTHVMASLFFYSLIFQSPSGLVLVALVGGAILPDLDVKFDHRRVLHFPFIYSLVAFMTSLFSLNYFSIFFGSAALHCVSEIFGNDAGEYVDKEKGAVYDHIRSKWLKGLNIIRQDGGPRDLTLLTTLTIAALTMPQDFATKLVAIISLILGLFYFEIRDRVEEIFPDFLLT